MQPLLRPPAHPPDTIPRSTIDSPETAVVTRAVRHRAAATLGAASGRLPPLRVCLKTRMGATTPRPTTPPAWKPFYSICSRGEVGGQASLRPLGTYCPLGTVGGLKDDYPYTPHLKEARGIKMVHYENLEDVFQHPHVVKHGAVLHVGPLLGRGACCVGHHPVATGRRSRWQGAARARRVGAEADRRRRKVGSSAKLGFRCLTSAGCRLTCFVVRSDLAWDLVLTLVPADRCQSISDTTTDQYALNYQRFPYGEAQQLWLASSVGT